MTCTAAYRLLAQFSIRITGFSLKCDITGCHIAVSRDHSLPEVQQQAEEVVKEASQCDDWKRSRVKRRCLLMFETHTSEMKRLTGFPYFALISGTGRRGRAQLRDWVTARLQCSRYFCAVCRWKTMTRTGPLSNCRCARLKASLCPHCNPNGPVTGLYCPHTLTVGYEQYQFSLFLHSPLYHSPVPVWIRNKMLQEAGPPALLYKNTWKASRAERIVP